MFKQLFYQSSFCVIALGLLSACGNNPYSPYGLNNTCTVSGGITSSVGYLSNFMINFNTGDSGPFSGSINGISFGPISSTSYSYPGQVAANSSVTFTDQSTGVTGSCLVSNSSLANNCAGYANGVCPYGYGGTTLACSLVPVYPSVQIMPGANTAFEITTNTGEGLEIMSLTDGETVGTPLPYVLNGANGVTPANTFGVTWTIPGSYNLVITAQSVSRPGVYCNSAVPMSLPVIVY